MNEIKHDNVMTLFDEVVEKKFLNEYDKEYYLTKGFNCYYLYEKSIYGNSYNTIATGMKAIKQYIKRMNLSEVVYDNNRN